MPKFRAWVLLLFILGACSSPPPVRPPAGPIEVEPAGAAVLALPAEEPEAGPIPVTAADATWGDAMAPVTLVMFLDFECRYCGDGARTVEELKRDYGPSKLRVAFKHLPLDIHDRAYAISVFAESLRARSGDAAFWDFYGKVFLERPKDESPEEAIGRALVDLGPVAASRNQGAEAAERGAAKVDGDLEVGRQLGVRGTPAFYVNGHRISGAVPKAQFTAVIDAELEAARSEERAGAPPSRLYALRTAANLKTAQEKEASAARKPKLDLTIWDAPVGASPQRGKADALVTIVMFSDFECPFCERGQKTMVKLEAKYGADIRFVYKHHPMPFHAGAEPAAELVQEVFTKKGAAAFWKAHDALYAIGGRIDDDDLRDVAAAAGLDPKATLARVKAKKHREAIEVDQELADSLDASATPTFFVNGRRLTGARSFEEFSETIDDRLAAAKALVEAGTPRADVYAALQKDAKRADPPQKLDVGAPPKSAPTRGSGPVIVQVFSDFECPFCQRHAASLAALEKRFPGKLTIVFRQLPLALHKRARPAAIAALEAQAQRGPRGFWQMHDLLFDDDADLSRDGLDAMAKKLGLNEKRFADALDGGKFGALLDEEAEAAERLGITGTPGTFIDGYFVSGAVQPVRLVRVVKLALADRKAKGARGVGAGPEPTRAEGRREPSTRP